MKRLARALLAGGVLTGLMILLYLAGVPFLHLVELKAQDGLFLARGPLAGRSGQVAVVAVGERSLDRLGRWPWPRDQLARLVTATASRGPKVMGLDIGFFEPDDRYPPQALREAFQAGRAGQAFDPHMLQEKFHPDRALAKAIRECPCPVILGWFFHMDADSAGRATPEELAARLDSISRFAFPAVRFLSPQALDFPLPTAYAPEAVLPGLLEAASGAGFFNVLPDLDGVVRRMPLVMRCRGRLYPSLALACLARQLGADLPRPQVGVQGMMPLAMKGRSLAVDQWGGLRLNLRGGHRAMVPLEAVDVMDGRAPAGAFMGKAVLIGATAVGLFDAKPTVYDPDHPALELQAQTLDNLLAGDFLREPGWAGEAALAAMLFLGLAASLAMGLARPALGGLACLGLGAGYLAFVYYAFTQGYLLSLVHPLLTLLAVGVGLLAWRYFGEEREKRGIRKVFQHYLHPSVIAELLGDPGKLHLGGQKRVLTVLFSDIRNFVDFCEIMEPEAVAGQLNEYMDRMAQVVLANQGVLDKFMGDALMAFFGAPMAQPDHAARACRTALAMQETLKELNQAWQRRGRPALRMGVGISTGPMIVGNMGSRQYFDYTVLGKAVNSGARLEELTKLIPGADIIVSQETRDACREEFLFRPLDRRALPGTREQVIAYQLLGARGQAGEPDWLPQVEKAFDLFLAGRRQESLALWQDLAEKRPDDAATLYMIKRLGE
ncbi:hypothetical protein AAU61_13765 [Desulfocarbo indianensis]|nr:hypothetical protein AAU61_13765 [Desulfocarbo indianensis]